MKRISLNEILNRHKFSTYERLFLYIKKEIENGKIKPVKASGFNGKTPVLYNDYWIIEEIKERKDLENEIMFSLHPSISYDYYLNHLDVYEKDRESVIKLSEAIKRGFEGYNISVNERSYEIWGYEKFLTQKNGKTILKRCGINLEDLNIYKTIEPIAYYSGSREVPQNILILENKDPFYGMRKYIYNSENKILGKKITTLIYGKGKGIIRAFEKADISMEDYILDRKNTIYYYGDMDYEGIRIYESFKRKFADQFTIKPFKEAYIAMLEKSYGRELYRSKEGQIRKTDGEFFSHFNDETVAKMQEILDAGVYIPQEILSINDYSTKYKEI